MLKIKRIVAVLLCFVVAASCKKSSETSYDDQVKKDDQLITEYIAKNNLTMTKHSSGMYFEVISPGSGYGAVASSTITVNYEGRLLDGTVFDKTTTKPMSFKLADVIRGWQIGIPLIENGGKIRLIVPSNLAYGSYPPSASIPKHAVLDFTIEILSIQ